MLALTVESLLQQFINVKQTGKEKPRKYLFQLCVCFQVLSRCNIYNYFVCLETIEFMEATITSKPVDIDALTQSRMFFCVCLYN